MAEEASAAPAQSAQLLEAQYGVWGSHPTWPVADWQYDVANCDTRHGYWDWVEAKLIAHETEAEFLSHGE